MKPDMETDIEDRFARMGRRLLLVAKLLGFSICDRCDGSGDGEREMYGGGWERCDCYTCDGAGVVKKEDEK